MKNLLLLSPIVLLLIVTGCKKEPDYYAIPQDYLDRLYKEDASSRLRDDSTGAIIEFGGAGYNLQIITPEMSDNSYTFEFLTQTVRSTSHNCTIMNVMSPNQGIRTTWEVTLSVPLDTPGEHFGIYCKELSKTMMSYTVNGITYDDVYHLEHSFEGSEIYYSAEYGIVKAYHPWYGKSYSRIP